MNKEIILQSGNMDDEVIKTQYQFTEDEFEKLLGTDFETRFVRLAMLNSCAQITLDNRCRTLTDGVPVPLAWLANQANLTAAEIQGFHEGKELSEEKKCRLFTAKMSAMRYLHWQVYPNIIQTYNIKQDEIWEFLEKKPEIVENIQFPQKICTPDEMLQSDTDFFCKTMGLSQAILEKIAIIQPSSRGEKKYSFLVTAAIWRNLLNFRL